MLQHDTYSHSSYHDSNIYVDTKVSSSDSEKSARMELENLCDHDNSLNNNKYSNHSLSYQYCDDSEEKSFNPFENFDYAFDSKPLSSNVPHSNFIGYYELKSEFVIKLLSNVKMDIKHHLDNGFFTLLNSSLTKVTTTPNLTLLAFIFQL